MKTKTLFMSAVSLCAVCAATVSVFAGEVNIIPLPQKISVKSGSFSRQGKPGVAFDSKAPGAKEAAALFCDAFGGELAADAGKAPVVFAAATGKIEREGYNLSVTPESVRVEAGDPAGFFYAVQTLRQLSPDACATGKLGDAFPAVEISDSPRYHWRGLLLDECRHFFGAKEVKRLLDQMAFYKMNVLHWHLTDDQGWRIEIDAYPDLAKYGSKRPATWKWGGKKGRNDGKPYGPFFYTKAQIREILDYAAKRHISIMPEIEMPGHSYAVVSVYPELYCEGQKKIEGRGAATKTGVFREVVCPSNPKVYEFYEKVLDEVCELFPSQYIHVGGDEVPRKNWKTCPRCQAFMKKHGMKNEAGLQSYFTEHFTKYLSKKGRRAIGWDEILEGGIPKETMVMSWRGAKGGIKAASAGHDVVMTPNTHCYFDYTYKRIPTEKAYMFNPCAGIPADKQSHVLGGQCNNWTERTPTSKSLESKIFPRLFGMAEALWTAPQKRDYKEFETRAKVHSAVAEKAGIKVTR